jgi:ubiquinone/menaquinone biosynthesis C-methylase UbiE
MPRSRGFDLSWLVADAERLPLADASVDSYTIAFGLRNVTRPEAALADAARVLRPGGRLMVLEFSHVSIEPLRSVYDAYSFAAIPAIGRLVVRFALLRCACDALARTHVSVRFLRRY